MRDLNSRETSNELYGAAVVTVIAGGAPLENAREGKGCLRVTGGQRAGLFLRCFDILAFRLQQKDSTFCLCEETHTYGIVLAGQEKNFSFLVVSDLSVAGSSKTSYGASCGPLPFPVYREMLMGMKVSRHRDTVERWHMLD